MGNRTTLKEVALKAKVSYQTVSKVVNHQIQVSPATEERIWQAVQELDYRPNLVARSLRSARTKLIGYSWAPTPPDQPNPILDQFLQSMLSEAEGAAYHLLAFPYHTGEEWTAVYRELIYTNRVDGFILSSVEFDDPRIQFLHAQSFPFVAFGRETETLDFPYVDVDGAAGMRMVIEHLVALGHRRFGILAWPASSRVGQNRMEGVAQNLAAAGIGMSDDCLLRGEGNYTFGFQAAHSLLSRPAPQRPTAIVAFNDIMAIGAMNAVRELGLQVGADVAVTGFDDAPMTQYLNPSLTTVRQPIWEVGRRVMSMMLEILDGRQPVDRHQLVTPRLIIRESTGSEDKSHIE